MERWDEAIAEQRVILESEPLKIDAYRALYRLYLQKQAYDEAWCLAAAMAFMKKADEEEQRFFEDYRPQGMLAVKGRLSNEGLGEVRLPRGREHLHLEDLRVHRAGSAAGKKSRSSKGKANCRCSSSASSKTRPPPP